MPSILNPDRIPDLPAGPGGPGGQSGSDGTATTAPPTNIPSVVGEPEADLDAVSPLLSSYNTKPLENAIESGTVTTAIHPTGNYPNSVPLTDKIGVVIYPIDQIGVYKDDVTITVTLVDAEGVAQRIGGVKVYAKVEGVDAQTLTPVITDASGVAEFTFNLANTDETDEYDINIVKFWLEITNATDPTGTTNPISFATVSTAVPTYCEIVAQGLPDPSNDRVSLSPQFADNLVFDGTLVNPTVDVRAKANRPQDSDIYVSDWRGLYRSRHADGVPQRGYVTWLGRIKDQAGNPLNGSPIRMKVTGGVEINTYRPPLGVSGVTRSIAGESYWIGGHTPTSKARLQKFNNIKGDPANGDGYFVFSFPNRAAEAGKSTCRVFIDFDQDGTIDSSEKWRQVVVWWEDYESPSNPYVAPSDKVNRMLANINDLRRRNGKVALSLETGSRATGANNHAVAMRERGAEAHKCHNSWEGENVGVTSDTEDEADRMYRGFYDSSSHRENMLTAEWRTVALGRSTNGYRAFWCQAFYEDATNEWADCTTHTCDGCWMSLSATKAPGTVGRELNPSEGQE